MIIDPIALPAHSTVMAVSIDKSRHRWRRAQWGWCRSKRM
jgi:hypothetical protein